MQSKFFSNVFITSTGIALPPDTHTRRLLVSPSRSSIAWYIVGTPSSTVTLSRAMISSALLRVEARDQREAGAGRDRRR